MNIHGRWFPAILTALMITLLAVVWVMFAPIQLGGQAAYIIITGNSMEPEFHTGDLVIIRSVPAYAIGDIVAYHNATLNRFVFHRIIGMELDRFVLKGDNNSWDDSYLPSREELVGKSWIHLPTIGKAVLWARIPMNMTVIAGALGGIFMSTLLMEKSRRKPGGRRPLRDWLIAGRRWATERLVTGLKRISSSKSGKSNELMIIKDPARRQGGPNRKPRVAILDGMVEGSFFALGLLAFGSLILGIFAFLRPSVRTVPDDIQYDQIGRFSYSAAGTPGIYDLETIRTGEPIFPNLTCVMNLTFAYTLVGDQVEDVSGTQQISAQVLDEVSGWQRTIALNSMTGFKGGTSSTKASLNLCDLVALTDVLEQQTNYFPPYYTLRIIPRITINGTLEGRLLQDAFEPPLTFRFDKLHFYLVKDDPEIDPLNPSATGLLKGTRTEANTLPILGLEPEVGRIRLLSVIGLILSASGMLILGTLVVRMSRSKESYVRMRYGSLLVDASSLSLEKAGTVVDLASIDDLARLADRKNSMILHETRGPVHYYLVQGDGTTYRFALSEQEDGLVEVSQALAEEELRRAFDRGEFQVYYQPIVSLTDRKITAVEALLRWQHPQRGLIPAKDFIPTAESTGLIQPIGEWMLQVACSQLKDWQNAGVPMELAVNFAESQLARDAVSAVSRVLKNTGIDPHTLQVEIPEMGIIKSANKILPKMQELRDLGIQISIDNFDGQLPVSSMGQYPINNVKIDRLLIQGIGDSENAASVERMATSVRNAGLNVMAVGVETEKQFQQLGSGNYGQAQGILLGNPVPAGDITLMLLKGNRPVKPKARKAKPVSGESSQ